jgi:small subunit ribosomal protein S6
MLMRKYENLFMVDSDLTDDAVASVEEKLKGIITGNDGMMLKWEPWGKRKLAYPVKRRTRANYILIEFAGGAGLVSELERNMRYDERILKFLTVKLEDRFDASAATEPAESAPAEEPAAASETPESGETPAESTPGEPEVEAPAESSEEEKPE